MRRRIATTLCAAAFAGAPTATAQEPAYSDWNPSFAGFPSNVRPDPAADCSDGSDACIARTIAEMWRRFHAVIPVCEHNAVFSLTYLRVTEDIQRALAENFYPDKLWLNRQDALFARLYSLSYSNWQAGRRALVPNSWRITYDSAYDRRVAGIGNLLLSMNAHINRDFPFALYHSGLRWPDGTSRKPQHDSYNQRLRALYAPMLAELAQRFDETIDDYDAPGTTYDDETLFQILVNWREGAWQSAERLAAAESDAERREVAQDIERTAEAEARFIYANTAYKPGETPARRDARCAAHGGQDPAAYGAVGAVAHAVVGKRRATAVRAGRVAITLACPAGGPGCSGELALRARGRVAGRAPFALEAGESRALRLTLDRAARRLLRERRRLRAVVVVRSQLRTGGTTLRRRTVVLRAARR